MRRRAPGLAYTLLLLAVTIAIGLTVTGCPSRVIRDAPPIVDAAQGPAPLPGSVRSATGCRVDTLFYRPEQPETDALAVLGHGFLRDQDRMADLALALAAAGIPTVTLNFCNSRLWDGRHVQNGRDMRRVADQLGAARVVYVGFSAGGLSALVAAWDDPRAVGVLTLDLVDDGEIGVGLARTLRVPLVGLQGEPAPCNAGANGRTVFAASPASLLLQVPKASHCDFESPTDWLCESFCGRSDARSGIRRQSVIERSVHLVAALLESKPRDGTVFPPRHRISLGSEIRPLS
jgi:hypothetical protein